MCMCVTTAQTVRHALFASRRLYSRVNSAFVKVANKVAGLMK